MLQRFAPPYRVVILGCGTWQAGISHIGEAIASWRSAPAGSAIYDSLDRRLDPSDGLPGEEIG